ncbi:hypothetical protein SJAV_18350 [Sulfurisphaera javensis]|uniref:Uncharacterized protein n=1 Tax=Sulfurisphaera javensis TaxID=2049879 RepID=A0AAT9GSX8_9CREN
MITESQIISMIVAFILGLLIGLLIKKVIQVGLIILAIVIILIAIGALSPSTVIHGLESLGTYAKSAESFVQGELSILPYNSILFIIGLVIGLIKG